MAKVRSLVEVRADVTALEAEIEALKTKAESEEGLTADEAAKLEELVGQLEAAKTEEVAASASERYNKLKAEKDQVQRTLPQYVASPRHVEKDESHLARTMQSWLGACRKSPNLNQLEEMRSAGFDPNGSTCFLPMDFRRLNYKNRAIMNTGGSGVGSEWASYKNYSDKVFEHLTYANPILGVINTETIANGTERYYYDVDDTANEHVNNSSETNPTLDEAVLVSGRNEIKPKTINSKVYKVSYEMLQDSPFDLESKITKGIANSQGRKLDRDLFTGAGNGVTDFQGIIGLCEANELPDADSWSIDEMEALVDSVPDYYRDGCIFVSNSATKSAVKRTLKDGNLRSYFDKPMTQDQRFETLVGHNWVSSAFVPDDQVLFFNPAHYTMVVVNGQYFIRLNEKYAPLIGWFSMMRAGGALTGAASAFASIKLDAGS